MRAVVRALALLLVLAPVAAAQGESAPARPPERSQNDRTSAGERFELNIDERRIGERDFEASTDVALEDRSGRVAVRVGASVVAERIELLLRGVQGTVRFRASLDSIRRLLDERQQPREPAR